MLKSFNSRTKLCNYVCAALTLCLLILQFTPFWHIGEDSYSINRYVWLECNNDEIASWFSSQLGTSVNINSIVISSVLILLLGVGGVVLCIMKSNVGLTALLPAFCSIVGIITFMNKPVFRLGSTWVIQLILCIAILAFAIMTLIFGYKKSEQEAVGQKALSQRDINANVAAIRALGEKGTKKPKSEDADSNFHKLISLLTDEIPEYRIAAVETLGKTSSDIAFTHISHWLSSEKNEDVKRAMSAALVSIRENMRISHSEKA